MPASLSTSIRSAMLPPNPLPPPEPPPPTHQQPMVVTAANNSARQQCAILNAAIKTRGFSKNGFLSLSLGMVANKPARHRPLFSVIPPFILGFPTSSVGNQIHCGAANTSRIKEAPRKVFAFRAAQPPTPQLAQESPLVDLDNVSGNTPQLNTTEHSPSESPPLEPSSSSPQPEQQGNIPRSSPAGQWRQYGKRTGCHSIGTKQRKRHSKRRQHI